MCKRNGKIYSVTHCCMCLEPCNLTKMQPSKYGYKARCEDCKRKAEENSKRRITPPMSPIPPKKGKEKEEDIIIYDSPEDIRDDPMEEVLPIITYNQPEESRVQKPKCSCWNRYSRFCEKHQHRPMIENEKCMMCPKIENVIKTKEARE